MAAQSIHIVGASLAGIRAAEALRRREFDGRASIALVLPRAADIAVNAFTVAARAVPG